MGRWSRRLARAFVEWLQPTRVANWLEIGCGTGALTSTICELCEPRSIIASDVSEPFVEYDPTDRELLRERLERRLAVGSDGRISLRARAWALRGVSR